jgi:hypothetical protein
MRHELLGLFICSLASEAVDIIVWVFALALNCSPARLSSFVIDCLVCLEVPSMMGVFETIVAIRVPTSCAHFASGSTLTIYAIHFACLENISLVFDEGPSVICHALVGIFSVVDFKMLLAISHITIRAPSL